MSDVRLAVLLSVLALGVCQQPLPTASATLHWATIDLPRASYCWSSGGHAECADSPGPEMLLKSGDLKPYRTAGGFDVKVTLHSTSTLKQLAVLLMVSPDGKAGPVPLKGADTFAVAMSPPAGAGVYVYVIRGTWPEGTVDFYLALNLIPGGA